MIHVVLICLVFGLIHSVTVSEAFKGWCRDRFGDLFLRVFYRALYTLVSTITAGAALWLISRVPDEHFWTAPLWLRVPMHAAQLAAFVFGGLAFRYLDVGEFMGWTQVLRYLWRGEVAGNWEGMTDKGLVTDGVYGIVRHPLYVAGIVIFTLHPVLTAKGITISVLADCYFLFGMFIEERRFLRHFGDQYRAYMQQVPRMIPRCPWRKRSEGGE